MSVGRDNKVRARLRSRRLAAELARRRLSQNSWARRFGVSPAYLSQLVSGKRRYPGAEVREAMLQALGLEFGDLFELEAPEGPVPAHPGADPSMPLGPSDRKRDAPPVVDVDAGRYRLLVERRPRARTTLESERAGAMESIAQDVRYATRMLAKRPLMTAIAVLTLALGIGANTTIFTLVKAVFLAGPPVADADRLVVVWGNDDTRRGAGSAYTPISYPNYEDFRQQSEALSGLAAYAFAQVALADGSGEPAFQPGLLTSADYFDVLGVEAQLGRTFRPEEEGPPGAHPVAVISDALWKERYAADPGVVGRDVRLNGHPFTIVGVAPPGFNGTNRLFATHVWAPVSMHPQLFAYSAFVEERGWRMFRTVGRLREGVDIAGAEAELRTLAARLEAEYPDANEGRSTDVLSLAVSSVGISPEQRQTIARGSALLLGVVGLLLLITCANVANLMLARARTRRREIAVRLSLGARRGRLVRQLVVESLMLSTLGGVGAVVLAIWGRDLLWAYRPPFLTDALDIGLDLPVLGFTAAVSIATGLAFGLFPALAATRDRLSSALQQRSPTAAAGRPGSLSLPNVLVVVQVALSVVALIGAGLFLNSLRRAHGIDPGFDVERLLLVPLNLDAQGYEQEAGLQLWRRLMEEAEALPGVERVAVSRDQPIAVTALSRTTTREGDSEEEAVLVGTNSVSRDYFEAMGIGVLRGRGFVPGDDADSRRVVVINDVLAEQLWPGDSPIGQRVRFAGEADPLEVVGIVESMKYGSLGEPPQPYLYEVMEQRAVNQGALLVRTAPGLEPTSLTQPVRSLVRELDPALPVAGIAAASANIEQSLWPSRMTASLLSLFGGLALVLAAVGMYGVLAQLVQQRSREIGIRIALGARHPDVVRLVALQSLRWVAVGGALGLGAAFVASRWVAGLLYGIHPTDPATYAATVVVLLLVASLAAILPARRASRVDPMEALREE